ncbi:DUF29 domain-containing protein [Spirulina subsalsa FACHB-351]|uniref:DUF29 domain-containing protein n=1 Tax=Spirulina subsalsa FACHB-351 TaxID=234711 RepID=A0ABT3L203_9CYAN|nr:DUF29 domain-containing protein [Spirulina subsalsa]MCW6035534.1 DUF29 domain-containing protein [Spirulina subsalsa FACHB-351]
MSTELKVSQTNLYNTDFVLWIETTVEQLRQQNYTHVDWENLLEELEHMARRERKSLKSNLIIIFLHLLKWQYQPLGRTGSWRGSLREHRRRIKEDLNDSPSLVPYLQQVCTDCYENARAQAADETGLPLETFPIHCPYSIEQALNSDYLPD